METGKQATLIGIIANAFLFTIKITAGTFSGSLSLLSDAVNSFSDTVFSIAIFIAVKVSRKKADADHPFGHHRAEPVAGLLVAMMTAILGFEIVKNGIVGLLNPTNANVFGLFALFVLIMSMVVKSGMWIYFKRVAKRINSPAISASSVDSRNDILISFIALIGLSGSFIGMPSLDSYVGIIIGFFIIYSGYYIGRENIDFLMGKAPDKKTLKDIQQKACSAPGVKGNNDVRAHYVGNYLHVEIHIEVDKKMSTKESHDIGKKVQALLEDMPSVDQAFVHIDPT